MPSKNVYWPLPPDYPELTRQGQKQARLSVVTNHSTPQNFVVAWSSFRDWYLKPSPSFYKRILKSPKFHFDMVSDYATYDINCIAAPRGGAKSIIVGHEIPLINLCTIPYSDGALCVAVDRMLPKRFDKIKTELEYNELLINDFGNLKPGGRGGMWSGHMLRLKNGAGLEGFSTEGRKRGARPDYFILDDPEFDVENPEMAKKLQESFAVLLFRIIIPMLEEGAKLFWIGTIIDRRSNIYRAIKREDPRFTSWNVRIIAACKIDHKTGRFYDLVWPEKWPADRLRHLQSNKGIGPANFASEFLNDPTSEQARLLDFTPLKNTYSTSFDPRETNRPLAAGEHEKISYHMIDETTGTYQPVTESYVEWINQLFRVIFIDFAYTATYTSDFSCVMTGGFCRKDILWPLDIWLGRVVPSQLHSEIMRQGIKWQAHMVCPESMSIQHRLMEEASQVIQASAETTGWYPQVIPPEYPQNTPKEVRIATALEWRFTTGRIKIPTLKGQEWETLRTQINDFTMDLNLLPYDDAIDTLAMSGYIRRKSGVPKEVEPIKMSYEDMLRKGMKVIPGTIIPLIHAVNINNLTPEVLDGIRENYYKRQSGTLSRALRKARRRPRW